MKLVDANKIDKWLNYLIYELNNTYRILNYNPEHDYTDEQKQFGTFIINHIRHVLNDVEPAVDAIPVWYIIRWYEKRYKLGSTVADDWERGFLKEKIAEMHDDFKNEKYLDNKQESGRFAQMVKEVIDLYNDWEEENETNRCR